MFGLLFNPDDEGELHLQNGWLTFNGLRSAIPLKKELNVTTNKRTSNRIWLKNCILLYHKSKKNVNSFLFIANYLTPQSYHWHSYFIAGRSCFKSWHGDQQHRLRGFEFGALISPSRRMSGQCIKIGHGNFLPHSLQ
jgi:hypothetical protein